MVLIDVNGYKMYLLKDDPGLSRVLAKKGIWEKATTEMVKNTIKPGMTVIDIGANLGYYALLESKLVGPRGKVYAIEPVEQNYETLLKNIELNKAHNIMPFKLAIGSANVAREMLLSCNSNHGTFMDASLFSGFYTERMEKIGRDKAQMEMLTLDRFIELQGIEKVDYIRMDVEGYEVEIAKGMTETLERFSPQVLMELHYVHFNDERILDKMVLDILSKGYEIGKLSNRKRAVPVSSLWDKEVRKACPHVLFKKRGRKIKILGALPELIRGAGAHRANLLLLDALVERGFDVKAYATRKAWDGLKIDFIFTRERKRVAELFDWADVIFTQGKEIPKIRSLIGRKPVIYYAHNNYRINTIHSFYEISEQDIDLLIFNAKWVLETTPWRNDSIVVNPPVFAEQFKTKPGDHITLVNIGVQKGGETFFELARRFPEKKFLGVKSWGKQFIPKEIPDNVTLISPTNNMRDDVYSKTKVLLMPSQYSGPTELWQWTESWGMVGVEAMSSGIPVIAHPAPGLLESLDYAGIFIDRKDYNGWEEAIRKLDDPDVYRRQSELSLKRVTELDPNPQIDALAEMIKRKLGYWKCYR